MKLLMLVMAIAMASPQLMSQSLFVGTAIGAYLNPDDSVVGGSTSVGATMPHKKGDLFFSASLHYGLDGYTESSIAFGYGGKIYKKSDAYFSLSFYDPPYNDAFDLIKAFGANIHFFHGDRSVRSLVLVGFNTRDVTIQAGISYNFLEPR